ncbi:MAG: hypothetical protein J6W03_05580 [Bacteroidaceae bacterium]|nr:hypothetical protein [Bacteroidaceae bacterium]
MRLGAKHPGFFLCGAGKLYSSKIAHFIAYLCILEENDKRRAEFWKKMTSALPSFLCTFAAEQ